MKFHPADHTGELLVLLIASEALAQLQFLARGGTLADAKG
jgi:hypothetical protein